MAKLIIQRSPEHYANRLISYSLFIDGKKAGIIADGKTKEYDVMPGEHTVVAKLDWVSSPEISFSIADSETKIIRVEGFRHSRWLVPVANAIFIFSLLFQRFIPFSILLCLSIPPFLVMLYYYTIGRKSYLSLTQ